MAKRNVKAIDENDTGRNINFKDYSSNRTFDLDTFVKKIENPNSIYNEGYHIRIINGVKTPVSNPDRSSRNNLE